MKPYGREKTVKGGNDYKIDYHLHKDGKKLENWWEDICCPLSRTKMKQNLKKDLDNEEN